MKKLLKSLGLVGLLQGCATSHEDIKVYDVDKSFRIILMEKDEINSMYKRMSGYVFRTTAGFIFVNDRILIIPYEEPAQYDANKQRLPNFQVLGHELWHLQELGGLWHAKQHKEKAIHNDGKY